MCIATLNVSTRSCSHRWYELATACHPANNLANCPARLKLAGWEHRAEGCPWCDCRGPGTQRIHESTHRLFGPNSGSSSSSTTSSSTSTAPTDLSLGRTWSWRSTASEGTTSPLSRHSSTASTEAAGQTRRDMHARLEIYLTRAPHEVLPSAGRNYPTYSAAAAEAAQGEGVGVRRAGALAKRWRGVRRSVGFGV